MVSDNFQREVRSAAQRLPQASGRNVTGGGARQEQGARGENAGRCFHALVRADLDKGNFFISLLHFKDRGRRTIAVNRRFHRRPNRGSVVATPETSPCRPPFARRSSSSVVMLTLEVPRGLFLLMRGKTSSPSSAPRRLSGAPPSPNRAAANASQARPRRLPCRPRPRPPPQPPCERPDSTDAARLASAKVGQ